MKPSIRFFRRTLAAVLLPAAGVLSATFTVSKDGRGAFTTIQAAVDKAGRNDIVEILDAAAYPEQVTIDGGKRGLTLRSSNPAASQKPVIRFQDVVNQGPRTCLEGLDPAKITYDRNGALRLIGAVDVTIEGVALDGGGPAPFAWPSVWGDGVTCNGQLYPLFHGNAALVLHRSAGITVRECVIRNAFFGVDVVEPNPTGAFAIPSEEFPQAAIARTGFAGTGGHLFENNVFARNTIGVAGETLYGLPSTFRNNRFFANGHATNAAARAVRNLPDGTHYAGAAVFMKGDPFCPWFFEHNTFAGNYLLFNGNYRPNNHHLVQANLFGPPSGYWGSDSVFLNPFQELFPMLWKGLRRNLVAAQSRPPAIATRSVEFSAQDDVAGTVVKSDSVLTTYVGFPLMNQFPMPESLPDTLRRDLPSVAGDRMLPSSVVVERVLPFASLLESAPGVEASRRLGNRWWEPRFASLDESAEAFLVPDWPARPPQDLRPTGADYRNRRDEAALPGCIPPADQAPTRLRVTPLGPVREAGGDLELAFEVEAQGPISGITVAGLVPVEIAALQMNGFGGNVNLNGNVTFHEVGLPVAAVQPGFNRLRIPRPWTAGKLGMVQLLLKGQVPGGGAGFSNWTAFPAGMYRGAIRVAVDGDSGSGPIEAPANGLIRVALSGMPADPAAAKIRLRRLSGLPIEYTDSSRVDSGWLASPAEPVEVRLSGNPSDLRYDGLLAFSAATLGNPPAVSGMSPMLRFPGASVGAARPKAGSRTIRSTEARDVLGRRIDPSRRKHGAVAPPFPPPGDGGSP